MMKTILSLLLAGISSFAMSQNSPTIGEIYNFEVGYQFHSRYGSGPPHATRLTVIDRRLSVAKDTIFYTMIDSGYYSEYFEEPEPHLVYHFLSDTVYDAFTHLDSSIYTQHLYPFLPKDTNKIQYFNSSWNYPDSLDSVTTMMVDTFTLSPNAQCGARGVGYHVLYGNLSFEYSERRRTYIKGAGMTSDYWWLGEGTSPYLVWTMFYYKLGEIECGSPDLTSSVPMITHPGAKRLSVFPNPCETFLCIKHDNLMAVQAVHIYSLAGELLLTQLNVDKVNVSSLEQGVYLLEAIIGDSSYRQVIIKK